MREITVYETSDGARFKIREDAEARERLIDEVNAAMACLPTPTPVQDKAMRNGAAYLQHDPAALLSARTKIVALSARELTTFFEQNPHNFDASRPAGKSFLGRYLSDNDKTLAPLNSAWYRLMKIDESGREWEQPYFVDNPRSYATAVTSTVG